MFSVAIGFLLKPRGHDIYSLMFHLPVLLTLLKDLGYDIAKEFR